MIKKEFILFCFFLGLRSLTYAQITIPDKNFLAFLKKEYSKAIDDNNLLIQSEAAKIDGTMDCSEKEIQSLEGLQYFTKLEVLKANFNKLSSLPDISALSEITRVEITNNNFVIAPNLSGQTKLKTLLIYSNQLTSLTDLSKNTALVQIIASKNKLTELPPLNTLVNLKKLDVGENLLTSLPNLDNLKLLEELTVWANELTTLPDVQYAPNLIKLNAGTNRLTAPPDVSKNLNLEEFSLDENQLTYGPDITNLTKFGFVELQNNMLSFADLKPYTSYPNFKKVFVIKPQNPIKVEDISGKEFVNLSVSTGIDDSISNNTYQWYFNGTLIATTNTNKLNLTPATSANQGKYYVTISNPDFNGMALRTDTFSVNIIPCLDISQLSFQISGVNCLGTGSVQIKLEGENPSTLLFELYPKNSSKIFQSRFGSFAGLTDENYTLKVSLDPNCTKEFPSVINLPVEPCIETFITPNNDGDKDEFFFAESGKVLILDKNGNKIKELSIPSEWNGTSDKGNIVPIGYYIANINNGASYVRISVLY